MRRTIAAGVAALVVLACMMPSVAAAAERTTKKLGPDGRVPGKWDLETPKKVAHPDTAPPTASGNGDGANGIHFTYFDDGDIAVVLGTATGHAGLFDKPYYTSGLLSWAIISANTTPRSAVQREQCAKYRTYDEAWALWVPNYQAYAYRARQYARSKIGQPYDIWSSKADQTKWYCSKLCWSAWRYTAGIDLDGDGGYWVWPVDLVNSSRTSAFGHWL
jgi:hypothetical protein